MTLLTLAGPGHLSRLLPLVAACQEELGIPSSDSRRRQALEPLLRGTPLGALWLIGPKMAPQGYVAVAFGWSLAAAGPAALLDEIWLRPEARGLGIGSQALDEVLRETQKRGASGLTAVIPGGNLPLATFLARRGILRRDDAMVAQRRS